MQFVKKHKVPFLIGARVIVAAVVLLLVLRGFGGGSNADAVYVQSVGELMDGGITYVSRFSGVAESQKTEKVVYDAQKTVKEIFVAAGDTVKKGDKLFTYDTELMQLDVQQAQLEIESLQNTVSTANAQITQYQRERSGASGSERLAYDAQIQQLQAEVNSTTYEIKTKQTELDRLKAGLENATVVAPVDGTVEAVGTAEQPLDMENTMVTLRNGGDLRIKGSVSEQNIRSITVGQEVIIRSRVDASQTWTGTIESIDTGSPEQSDSDMYSGSGGGERASFYAFYVDLEEADGIIMGQHVTIEPDYGQTEVKDGIWLSSAFIVQDEDGESYVWAQGSRGRLQKQPVTLGDYDEELDEYQILDGLTVDDYIAWPDETCVSGAATTTEMVWDEGDWEEDWDEGEWDEGDWDEGEFGSFEEDLPVAEPVKPVG